jgi:beta-N-acetylhexosaminidase
MMGRGRSMVRGGSGRRIVLVLAAALVVSAGCVAGPLAAGKGRSAGGERAHLRQVVAGMSLREKVGQLFVTYVYGSGARTKDPQAVRQNRKLYGVDNGAQLVRRYHLGGIIYFNWSGNENSPRQIARLSNGLQRAAVGSGMRVPLVIGTDQEQGLVRRVGPPATQFPGNMALGATRSARDARVAAAITGEELRAIGINQDYAPVVDVNTNPLNQADGVRSFGDRPVLVSRMTRAQVAGYQREGGVAATAKHFPGLGDTTINTDNGVAVTHESRGQIFRTDLPPFRAAVGSGIDSIMAAHIIAPALDASRRPASLSRPIVTGILREKLGYNGVVVTDALSAGALAGYDQSRIPVMAIKAGDDQLLMPTNLKGAINSVASAVKSGKISERRIDRSVLRILLLKYKLGLFGNPYVNVSRVSERVGTPQHLREAARIANQSITLVKNRGHLLPLAKGNGRHVLVVGWSDPATGSLATLSRQVRERGLRTTTLPTGYEPTQTQIDEAKSAAKASDLVIAATNNAEFYPQQQKLIRALLGTGRPVVVVALGNPYDIAYFRQAPVYVAAYGYRAVSERALARVLFGEVAPSGRLPVTIRSASKPHRVLYPFGWRLRYAGR